MVFNPWPLFKTEVHLVHKPNTDFGIISKYCPHDIFGCFPFLSKVLLTNMDDATSALLRKLFQGVLNMYIPDFAWARKLVTFHTLFYTLKLHLYERPYKYKRNETFSDSL